MRNSKVAHFISLAQDTTLEMYAVTPPRYCLSKITLIRPILLVISCICKRESVLKRIIPALHFIM